MRFIFFILSFVSFSVFAFALSSTPPDCGEGGHLQKKDVPPADEGCSADDITGMWSGMRLYIAGSDPSCEGNYPISLASQAYECVLCEEPDENNTVPLDENTSEVDFWNTCEDPATASDHMANCQALGGVAFMTSRVNCCEDYICLVDNNGSNPPENPCPVGQKPSDTHPDACVPDHPDGTCPIDQEMCICGGDGNNDQCRYSFHDCMGWMSQPVESCDTPSNCPNGADASGQCCSPGETVCNGHCQLNGVPCNNDPDTNGTDPNNPGDGGGKPCEYPTTKDGLRYRGYSYNMDECFNDAKIFSDVGCDGNPLNVSYEKNNDCDWGACYYNDFTKNPDCNGTQGGGNGGNNDDNASGGGGSSGDSNGTGIDTSRIVKKLDQLHEDNIHQTNKLTNKLTELEGTAKGIKNQVKQSGDQLANILNSMNEAQGSKLNKINNSITSMNTNLGSKLDALNQSIQDKNLSVNVENNISIDLNTTNSLLAGIRSDLNSTLFFNAKAWGSSMLSFENAFDNAQVVFNDSLTIISQTLTDLRSIADGSSPTVSYSGSCSLDFALSFGTFSIDLSTLNDLRPYFAFFLNLVLLFFVIKFYSWIGQYLIRLLVEAL